MSGNRRSQNSFYFGSIQEAQHIHGRESVARLHYGQKQTPNVRDECLHASGGTRFIAISMIAMRQVPTVYAPKTVCHTLARGDSRAFALRVLSSVDHDAGDGRVGDGPGPSDIRGKGVTEPLFEGP